MAADFHRVERGSIASTYVLMQSHVYVSGWLTQGTAGDLDVCTVSMWHMLQCRVAVVSSAASAAATIAGGYTSISSGYGSKMGSYNRISGGCGACASTRLLQDHHMIHMEAPGASFAGVWVEIWIWASFPQRHT
jgi:hypothetical protein